MGRGRFFSLRSLAAVCLSLSLGFVLFWDSMRLTTETPVVTSTARPEAPPVTQRSEQPSLVAMTVTTSPVGLSDGVIAVWDPKFLKAQALVQQDDALQLTPKAVQAVNEGLVRPTACPSRYVFVNTHTFGRHHNQLQEMLNLVAWGRTLNRTAVIGWFRYNHKWIDAEDLYNFTLLYRDYCVLSATEFTKRWAATPAGERSAACIGQPINDTPLKGIVRRCKQQPGVPAYYNSRFGVDSTQPFLAMMVHAAPLAESRFLGVSGEIAFFLRPGLLDQVAVATRVGPSEIVSTLMATFAQKHRLRLMGHHDRGGDQPYCGLHLRQREKECAKEMSYSFEDGKQWLQGLTADQRKAIESQCALTVPAFEAFRERFVGTDKVAYFVASDRQNVELELALKKMGSVMFEGGSNLSGLIALAVDFNLLQHAKYFTGNQLSSISQNCCFARLGRGLGCHGFVPAFTMFHSRNTEPSLFIGNLRWTP